MMNTKNMFVFAVAFLLLTLSYTTSTDGLSLRVVRVTPTTSSTVDARQVDVELSTPSDVVTGIPVAHVVQDLSAPQDPVAQDYVEGGVPVKGVPVAHVVSYQNVSRIKSWLRRYQETVIIGIFLVFVGVAVAVVIVTDNYNKSLPALPLFYE